MDSLFEYRLEISKETFLALYQVYYQKKKRASKWLLFGIGLLGLAVCIYSLYTSFSWAFAVGFAVCLRFCVLPLFVARRVAARTYKNHVESNLPLSSTGVLTKEGLTLTNAQGSRSFKWSQVQSGYQGKGCAVLFVGNEGIYIGASSLTKGTYEELLAFLAEKTPLR